MSNDSQPPKKWDRIITSHRPWFDLQLVDVWRYRDLIALFFHRDFVSTYKQTVLGPVWFILQPLLSTAMYSIVFGEIAKLPTSGLPPFIFYMAGIIMWGLFSNCLMRCSSVFGANAGIFSKVYFPRLTVPISSVLSILLTFGLQLLMFLAFLAFFYIRGNDIRPNIGLLIVPLLVLQACLMGVGIGCIISSLTTRYRDLQMALGFGMQLWMYASCIFYSKETAMANLPPNFQWVMNLNPIVPIIENFRAAFLGGTAVNYLYVGISTVVALVFFAGGVMVFNRVEKDFADTI